MRLSLTAHQYVVLWVFLLVVLVATHFSYMCLLFLWLTLKFWRIYFQFLCFLLCFAIVFCVFSFFFFWINFRDFMPKIRFHLFCFWVVKSNKNETNQQTNKKKTFMVFQNKFHLVLIFLCVVYIHLLYFIVVVTFDWFYTMDFSKCVQKSY